MRLQSIIWVLGKTLTTSIQPPRKPKLLGSSLIEFHHFVLFVSWIDKKDNLNYNFKLLYRATSRDGTHVSNFHNKCDNRGATIVIAKVKGTNQIIGGYNPLVWDSNNSIRQQKIVL
ncbi:unnamed protein product [Rhizophagus irregularis]|nr:unnamed protein product [Rhizophagus irregularis]